MTPPQPKDTWVAVAVLQKPHGLDGTIRLRPLTRTTEDFLEAPLKELYLRRGSRVEGPVEIDDIRIIPDCLLVHFKGFDSREAIEPHVNGDVVIREEDRWELPPGEYYIDQLQGLEVRDAASGARIGRVTTATDGLAHDYLILDLEAAPGKETMLPILPQFVPRVDVAGGFVEVVIPAGLVD